MIPTIPDPENDQDEIFSFIENDIYKLRVSD
jgi:hypothetical protein